MNFFRLHHIHPYYPQTLALRNLVLRKPLGMDLFEEDLKAERDQIIFVAEKDALIIACLMLQPLNNELYKLRQMAVCPEWKGQGFGRRLIMAAEAFAQSEGIKKIKLHARQTASGFYEKLGYQSVGIPFEEIGIPHLSMEKQL